MFWGGLYSVGGCIVTIRIQHNFYNKDGPSPSKKSPQSGLRSADISSVPHDRKTIKIKRNWNWDVILLLFQYRVWWIPWVLFYCLCWIFSLKDQRSYSMNSETIQLFYLLQPRDRNKPSFVFLSEYYYNIKLILQ